MKQTPTIKLDSILLLILGFYFLYRHNVDTLFFVIFFISVFIYVYIDSLDRQKIKDFVKKYLLFFIIGLCVVTTLVPQIILRAGNPEQYMPHDNVVQVEAAVDYILAGKNPYTEDYFDTPLEKQAYVMTTLGEITFNTSIYHCIKLPWHILSAMPFKLFSQWIIGFYDQRILYLILFFVSLLVVYSLPKQAEHKRLFTLLYALNPLFVSFFVSGRGDVFVLTWLLLTLYFLNKKNFTWSAIMLGLACISKHSAWFFVPFYLLYVYWQIEGDNDHCRFPQIGWWQNIKKIISKTFPLALVFLVFMLPFIIWDPLSFWQDIYQYPSGALATSYHINGYGFSMLLYKLGVIETIHSLYPAWIFQLPLGLILFYHLYRQQKKSNTIAQTLFGYSLFIFVFWFFARFFHDNYVGYLSQTLLMAYFVSSSQSDYKRCRYDFNQQTE